MPEPPSPDTTRSSARPPRRPHPSQTGPILSAIVIVLAGFGIALVERSRFPKGSVWVVVATAVALIALIRFATRGR